MNAQLDHQHARAVQSDVHGSSYGTSGTSTITPVLDLDETFQDPDIPPP